MLDRAVSPGHLIEAGDTEMTDGVALMPVNAFQTQIENCMLRTH